MSNRNKISKNEEIDLTTILEKCSQIMKEDRNLLRTALKDSSEEIVLLLRKHKKKLELPALQIELRKILNKLKGKSPSQTNLPPSQHSTDNTKKNPEPKSLTLQQQQPQPISKPNIKALEKSPPENKLKENDVKPDKKTSIADNKGNHNTDNKVSHSVDAKTIDNKGHINESKVDAKGHLSDNKVHSSGDAKGIMEVNKAVVPSQNTPKKSNNGKKQMEKKVIVANDKKFEKTQVLDSPLVEEKGKIENKVNFNTNERKEVEKKAELGDKKIVKKMDQLEHVDDGSLATRYETPSFKNQPQASFRKDLNSKASVLAKGLLIKPNDKALAFMGDKRKELEKDVDLLLNLKEISEFSGEKIEVFKEMESINISDLALPSTLEDVKEKKNQSETIETLTKAAMNIVSPTKSEKISQKKEFIRPSVVKTIKFITEKPKTNMKIITDLQKSLGIVEIPPEVIFDKVIGDVHLSRTSKTYFKYKIEALLSNRDPQVQSSTLDRLFELCDIKKDGFIDLNELGFSLENLCNGVLKPNIIKEIYSNFDAKKIGFFKEDDFVRSVNEINENIDENAIRSFFQHLDEDQKGIITYWDLYFLKNHDIIEELKELCGLEGAMP